MIRTSPTSSKIMAINAVVTFGLLGFAYLYDTQVRAGGSVATLVLGAVLNHWFREAQQIGQEIGRDKAVEREVILKEHGAGNGGT